jgi:hypothetical protein
MTNNNNKEQQQMIWKDFPVPVVSYAEATIQRWNPRLRRYEDEIEHITLIPVHNLTLNKLRDALADRLYTRTTNDGPRGAGFIALSENNTAPAVGDTTMSGETSLSGLTRADATTKSHSAGTNTTSVSHQFTAGAAGTIMKAGLFTASSAGDPYHVTVFASNAVLAINDLLTVTFTITHA